MSKPKYATLAFSLAMLAAACGRDPMTVPDDLAGQGGRAVLLVARGVAEVERAGAGAAPAGP